MRRSALLPALLLALLPLLVPGPALASQWGSSYGDPPGFCPAQSFLPSSYTSLVTNDPSVALNPERDTFWGWHPVPGYDDWYGYWYGDFRGTAGDASGWTKLMTVPYGSTGHWDFSDFGWAVHGHAKQYIAYYNWTFGGLCGLGNYGAGAAPPYMADVYGNPVVDIYVDSTPPWPPQPAVSGVTATSVSFAWPPVSDRGDGAGADYFASGLDHYTSWLEVAAGAPQQYADTSSPRTLTASGLTPGTTACVFVTASDALGNTTPASTACAQAAVPPVRIGVGGPPGLAPTPPVLRVGKPFLGGPATGPAPAPPPAIPAPAPPPAPPSGIPAPSLAGGIAANPNPGLTGLASWFWLTSPPAAATLTAVSGGTTYRITETPSSVAWDFGDGTTSTYYGAAGFGLPYPQTSTVTHAYQSISQAGYPVSATVSYTTTWSASLPGGWTAPAPGPSLQAALSLSYRVRQAQPELG